MTSSPASSLHVVGGDDPTDQTDGAPVRTILVHGAMDRHNSFRRVARRLDQAPLMYDRRGYAKSIDVEPAVRDLERHVADLVSIIGDRPAIVVGHSVGGLIALTTAAHFPSSIVSVAAYEPPTGWKSWWPDDLCVLQGESPEQTVERFYTEMVGDPAWDRLSESARSGLLSEGQALQVDLEAGRRGAPFEPSDIAAPVLLGYGTNSNKHHIRATQELAGELPSATLEVIDGAYHGAHRSHADAFAEFVERAVRAA
jgi:pimeloyl-ACP methyl ester carboxylesterase